MSEEKETESKEMRCSLDTLKHIVEVRNTLDTVISELMTRAQEHDQTKLSEPELSYFANAVDLRQLTFGSPEYQKSKDDLQPALDHHYARYRHHPEHFPNGVNGMNLIDILEMFCDWKASSKRQHDGNLVKSIETASKKYGMSSQLASIFKNTADYLDQ
jgi:hypothetical protein